MNTILTKLKSEKKYVCIHTDEANPSKFIFGKIIGFDTKSFAVSMVSPDGEYDGVLVKQIDDILYINQSLSYEEKMKKLMRIKGYDEKITDTSDSNSNIIEWSLFLAKKLGVIISVEINHSGVDDITGFVESIDEGICKMILVNEYGVEDGVSFFALRDISQICLDSCDERRLLTLFQYDD